MYRDIPTVDEMVKDLPTHMNFYVRGVFNSILPQFINPLASNITETEVSGEMLEALRMVANKVAPDLEEGETVGVTYEDLRGVFKEASVLEDYQVETIGDMIRTSLGAFALSKKDGAYVVTDAYDFSDEYGKGLRRQGKEPRFMDYIKGSAEANSMYQAARIMGGYMMPENTDGSSTDDAMRIRIRIPKEPEVIETEFDDDPQAEQFVFTGAMTTKRKSLFERVFGSSQSDGSASVEVSTGVEPPKPRPTERG